MCIEVVVSLQSILSDTLACFFLSAFHIAHELVLISLVSTCRDGVHPVISGLAAAVLGQCFLSSQQQQVGICSSCQARSAGWPTTPQS